MFLLHNQSHSEIADILDLRIEIPTAEGADRPKVKDPYIPYQILPTIPEYGYLGSSTTGDTSEYTILPNKNPWSK